MNKRNIKDVLLIAAPGIGDALLSTPLVRSIKNAFPDSSISIMVREGQGEILRGIPEINQIIEVPKRMGLRKALPFLSNHLKEFELGISTASGDRWLLFCSVMAKRCILLVPNFRFKDFWKYLLPGKKVIENLEYPTILQNLSLLSPLKIEPCVEVMLPQSTNDILKAYLPLDFDVDKKFAVIHIIPGYAYKQWAERNWKQLIAYIIERGLQVVLTSGPDVNDIAYINYIKTLFPEKVISLAGKLPFSALGVLLKQAALYVGPDTSTTHLAAASGCLTIALYGPTPIRKWAPWPKNYRSFLTPFSEGKMYQRRNNVILLQGTCVENESKIPCFHRNGDASLCLETLKFDLVKSAVDECLSSM